MPTAKDFFSEEQQQEIIRAIKRAEGITSGEIRVHLEEKSGGDPLKRAAKIFRKLKMHDTHEKNGVLIYLAIKEKQFAIIGDAGIHARVGDDFWDTIKTEMQNLFQHEKFVEGILFAIDQAGEQLKQYFPFGSSDKNELSDEISF